ncbi:hypothetical protein [Methylobacterium oryzisoli]|uniref:hypothetical protein n=1 Tax=Methylobacterium oryzisoli TaxID=3385502 RepID=UPI00389252E5
MVLRLRGASYLLQADFAVRREVGDFQPYIEVHWHGLLWADARKLDALRVKFGTNRFGAPELRASAVYDLPGSLSYIAKDTRLGYVTVRKRAFCPASNHSEAWFNRRDRLQSRHRRLLIKMVGDLTKPELCTASKAARAILRDAKRLAADQGYGRPLMRERLPVARRRRRG